MAQARNPYSLQGLWIPGSRFACPGMTAEGVVRICAMRKLPVVQFSLASSGKSPRSFARLAPTRGALRDRHERWKRDAMDAACRQTNNMTRTAKSCGPGAPRLALSCSGDDPSGDGGKKAWSPGRARISRKTIAQGRPDDFGCACGSAACFFLHADHGCQPAPGLPCALCFRRGHVDRKTRVVHAARTRSCGSNPVAAETRAMRAPQDEVLASGTLPDRHGEEAHERRLRTMLRIAGRTIRPATLPEHLLLES